MQYEPITTNYNVTFFKSKLIEQLTRRCQLKTVDMDVKIGQLSGELSAKILRRHTRVSKRTGSETCCSRKHVETDRRMRSADLIAGEALVETALSSSHVRQY